VLKFIKSLYLEREFFFAYAMIIILFITSFLVPAIFEVSKILMLILLAFTFLDILILYSAKKGISAKRICPDKLSNGDENAIVIELKNHYTLAIKITIIDEVPVQFQKRDFKIVRKLKPTSQDSFQYSLRPTVRGEFWFGKLIIYVQSPIRLISRRFNLSEKQMVPSYPSYIQLKKFDLIAAAYRLNEMGVKKVRRIGHTMEFEQIKEYVLGDDIRTINWKATAKRNQLMVNQFQDERSQPVYSVIDKGRVMQMPFDELSLLDYAINASLVISSVALRKQDRAGIFTFSKKVENRVAASRRAMQMNMILEGLYNVKTDFKESDYSRLYADIKRNITQRSLILLYTNFETMDGLHRQLPYLKGIAKNHLLVVIFFKNAALNEFVTKDAEDVKSVYNKVIAEKFLHEKKLIVNELRKYGIQSILTEPKNLTINTINKYLEVKARGLI
jgi:uncharacterized protein (DUF58 family)